MIISFQPSKRAPYVLARPMNCDFDTTPEKRCDYCGQNHLRPGYCQALDPRNAEKYPHLHQSQSDVSDETESHKVETETENDTDESQPWVSLGISRATYFRRRKEGQA